MKDEVKEVIEDENELESLFNQYYPPAVAIFYNQTPPDWQVNIIQIGCKFVYDDGHNDNKGNNVNIRGGQSSSLTASYRGCCRSYIVVIKAKASDGRTWDFFDTATVDDNYCGSTFRWHLVPQQQIAKNELNSTPPFKLVRA